MNPTTDERSGKTERWNVQMKKKTKKKQKTNTARGPRPLSILALEMQMKPFASCKVPTQGTSRASHPLIAVVVAVSSVSRATV